VHDVVCAANGRRSPWRRRLDATNLGGRGPPPRCGGGGRRGGGGGLLSCVLLPGEPARAAAARAQDRPAGDGVITPSYDHATIS
jgi:hypothetical protein